MIKQGYLLSISGVTRKIASSKPLNSLVKQFAPRSFILPNGDVRWISPKWKRCVRAFDVNESKLTEGYIHKIVSVETNSPNKFVRITTINGESIETSSDVVIQVSKNRSRVIRDLRVGDMVLLDYTFRHKGLQEIAIADIDYVKVNSAYTIETKGHIGVVCNKFIVYGDVYYES